MEQYQQCVWVFPLRFCSEQTINMPTYAQVLSAQLQSGALCVWALVCPEAPLTSCTFRIFSTGQPILGVERLRYVGTVQRGELVYHVFMDVEGRGGVARGDVSGC